MCGTEGMHRCLFLEENRVVNRHGTFTNYHRHWPGSIRLTIFHRWSSRVVAEHWSIRWFVRLHSPDDVYSMSLTFSHKANEQSCNACCKCVVYFSMKNTGTCWTHCIWTITAYGCKLNVKANGWHRWSTRWSTWLTVNSTRINSACSPVKAKDGRGKSISMRSVIAMMMMICNKMFFHRFSLHYEHGFNSDDVEYFCTFYSPAELCSSPESFWLLENIRLYFLFCNRLISCDRVKQKCEASQSVRLFRSTAGSMLEKWAVRHRLVVLLISTI